LENFNLGGLGGGQWPKCTGTGKQKDWFLNWGWLDSNPGPLLYDTIRLAVNSGCSTNCTIYHLTIHLTINRIMQSGPTIP
jgi:hypothetical protein